jgi:non-heme chloroperoxidase
VAYVTVGQDNTTDIALSYEDRGSGPPVILIHGWPLPSRSWESQVLTLVEDGYRKLRR